MKSFWLTLLLAATPVIELRGAIPAGVASGLSLRTALIISIIGNLLPVPFILLFTRGLFDWMKKRSERLQKLVQKMELKAHSKKETIDRYEWFGLVILVAIPFPGTGAWTGALVAAVFDMRLKRALPAITLGVIIAGVLVSYLTYGATQLF